MPPDWSEAERRALLLVSSMAGCLNSVTTHNHYFGIAVENSGISEIETRISGQVVVNTWVRP